MEWLETVELYLHNRLNTTHPTDAIKLLNRYPIIHSQLQQYVHLTKDVIQEYWESVNGDIKAKLTSVSVYVGKAVMMKIKCSKEFDNDTFVKIGDLLVEGFFQTGYVHIEVPQRYSSTPVYIVPTEQWAEEIEISTERLIRGLYSRPPKRLNLMQDVQWEDGPVWTYPTIKRWTEESQPIYDTVVSHCAALRAAEKLTQTGWQINSRVLEAVRKHKFKFTDKSSELAHKYTMQYADQLNGKEFYYAPEFDYRGRLYFTMPYLNFQGSDTARGILLFSNKKYVSERGLRWMKVHAAASYNQSYSKDSIPAWCTADYKSYLDDEGLDNISVDKMTLLDRELWVDNNWDLIERTAEGIIHDCEKPVSFLAVAIELVEYSKSDFYFSALPIPVDGSNNGWQHLGAISKDTQTGRLVGLTPVDIQQDFYVQTAKKLIEITKDERRAEILAAMPMKKIRKGISKRGSMTRAYSAGAQKIAENMYQDCKKEGYVGQYGIDEKDCKGFARDLVKAIEQVCPGPLQTMKYLQKLAGSQLENGEENLTWVTPSGFPVIYDCYHTRTPTVVSKIKGVNPKSKDQIGHKIMITSTSPDKRGFMCGISPNFIHSQDAAHMQLVIDRFDGDFGAVHDSFSTHANEVDDLVDITKQVFIEMYSHENYFNRIKEKLGGDAEQPTLGNLNIKEIEDSDYFFA